MISAIIPIEESAAGPLLQQSIARLRATEDIEIIFVAKGENPTRSGRLNRGIRQAKGEMILLVHPRSEISAEALSELSLLKNQKVWGGFRHRFDLDHPLLKLTSWYSNQIRGQLASVIYLDHCIFFHKTLLGQPIPEVFLFEDTLLSRILRKKSPARLLRGEIKTSAIRFQKNGIYRQAAMNQVLKIGFYIGVPDKILNDLYEKNLHLN